MSLLRVDLAQLAALHRVEALLIDARSELEIFKLHTAEANALHGEISRSQGLCWQIIHDEIEKQREPTNPLSKATEA